MKDLKLSKGMIVLTVFGFLAAGFIGIVGGNLFMNWKNAKAAAAVDQKFFSESEEILQPGDPFPELDLIDCDGITHHSTEIIRGSMTVILFISPECRPCAEAAELWSSYKDNLPTDLRVIGIANGDFEYACEYAKENNFPYPFFCDINHVLAVDYGINRYPAAMGFDEQGRVAFTNRGLFNDLNPLDAYKLILESENIQ